MRIKLRRYERPLSDYTKDYGRELGYDVYMYDRRKGYNRLYLPVPSYQPRISRHFAAWARGAVTWKQVLSELGWQGRQSGDKLVALCPAHSEKTPSVTMWPNSRFFCHGCNQQGDVVDFVIFAAERLREEGRLEPSKLRTTHDIKRFFRELALANSHQTSTAG